MSTFRQMQLAIGVVVRQGRAARQWSIRDMEKVSGVNKSMLSRIEHGKANPCLRTIEKLAEAFDQTPADFIHTVERVANGKGGAS